MAVGHGARDRSRMTDVAEVMARLTQQALDALDRHKMVDSKHQQIAWWRLVQYTEHCRACDGVESTTVRWLHTAFTAGKGLCSSITDYSIMLKTHKRHVCC